MLGKLKAVETCNWTVPSIGPMSKLWVHVEVTAERGKKTKRKNPSLQSYILSGVGKYYLKRKCPGTEEMT